MFAYVFEFKIECNTCKYMITFIKIFDINQKTFDHIRYSVEVIKIVLFFYYL